MNTVAKYISLSSAVHRNPFGDKCIHGAKGARIVRGYLRSPSCPRCADEQAHQEGRR